MNPVYFGDSATRLYGVYHPAKGASVRDEGVVLCYPMGQEYMRAHRAFRMLALMLAKRGFHVFRFDFYGTGDSAGESGEGDLVQWGRDLEAAVQELKETADVARVSLVGLRLGATIATRTCVGREDVERLVLWDPVADGKEFVGEVLGAGGADPAERRRRLDAEGHVGVLGFPLRRELLEELEDLDLVASGADGVDATKIYLVVSHERPSYLRLGDALASRNPHCERECIPAAGRWNEVDNFGSALVPQEIIQGIVRWVSA